MCAALPSKAITTKLATIVEVRDIIKYTILQLNDQVVPAGLPVVICMFP
jgi:hypothetical protein